MLADLDEEVDIVAVWDEKPIDGFELYRVVELHGVGELMGVVQAYYLSTLVLETNQRFIEERLFLGNVIELCGRDVDGGLVEFEGVVMSALFYQVRMFAARVFSVQSKLCQVFIQVLFTY